MFNTESPLRLLHDFEIALKNYKPSLDILDLLQSTKLVLLVAPSAAGRNTLIKNLIMTGRYYFLVSDTTRRPRINDGVPERSGVEYWFKSEEEVLQGLKNGAYIEAAIIHNQQVSGVSFAELRRANSSGMVAITDIDIQGCDNIHEYSDTMIPIFVLPPNFDEWMRRLEGRGAMELAEKRRRLESAAAEIQLALERQYFKFVINWDIKLTVEEIHEHVISGNFGSAEQAAPHSRPTTVDRFAKLSKLKDVISTLDIRLPNRLSLWQSLALS